MTRTDYKFADVSNVVLTGQTLPDREAAGVFAPPKHEDLAFLTEACWERGLVSSDWPAPLYIPHIPTIDFIDRLVDGGRDRGEAIPVGQLNYANAPHGRVLLWLAASAVIPDVFETSVSSADGGGIYMALMAYDQSRAIFVYRSQFAPQWMSFVTNPIVACGRLIRHLFYTLKNQRRMFSYARNSDSAERWVVLRFSGTASYSYRSTSDGSTSRDYSGSANYSDVNELTDVPVPYSGTQTGTVSVYPYPQYSVTTTYSASLTTGEVSTSRTVVLASVSALRFKTKVAYNSVCQFLHMAISATRYARTDGDVTNGATETARFVYRRPCTLVATIQDDPDGWVQEWAVDITAFAPPMMMFFAQSHGFHIPGETASTYGMLSISVLGYNVVDCEPAFKTEIDPNNAWGWTPA